MVCYESRSRSVIHYLDDFLFIAPKGSDARGFRLDTFRFLMERFVVQLSVDKAEGPVTVISFLGIEIDSVAMGFRLPHDKLVK